jgi:type IV secretory pathway VirJ component
MALATYSDLKTSIANWLNRSDLTTEIANDFIVLSRSRFQC